MFPRQLRLPPDPTENFFLWGPRQAGKTSLLRATYPHATWIDLLKTDEFARYARRPALLREEVPAVAERSVVVIDEFQKVPALLDEVHWLIENCGTRFARCGSSARKVRRGAANLLGGRAVRHELLGLVSAEIGAEFGLVRALNHGYLPRHYLSGAPGTPGPGIGAVRQGLRELGVSRAELLPGLPPALRRAGALAAGQRDRGGLLAGLRELVRDQPGLRRRIVVCLAERPRAGPRTALTSCRRRISPRACGATGSCRGSARAPPAAPLTPARERANNRGTMARGGQLERQWRLLQLIDRAAGVTVDDAAADLGCTRRTIFRDLRVLQNAGFPIYDDPAADGPRTVWRVSEGFKQRLPLRLTLDEVAALLMSEALLAPAGASLLGPSVAAAFDRIRGVLSRDALALLGRMREAVGVRALGAKLQQPAAELLPTIHAALAERRTLQVRYHTFARDEDTERELDPYHLTYYDGGLYLVAHCHLRHDVRVFAVERFLEVAPTGRRFEVPAGFDVRGYLDRALGIVQGELVTVRVAFAASLARYVRDRLWHPSQRLRDLPDGRLELALRVADTPELRRWLLGYGVQAEVLEPSSIREALRAEAEALAARLVPTRRPLARGPAPPAEQDAPPQRRR